MPISKKTLNCMPILFAFIFIMIFGKFSSLSVMADTANFQISPITSEMQLNKKVSYFDLKLDPGTTTNIHVEVDNTSSEPIHVMTYVQSATTSDNGNVIYNKSNTVTDKSLKYRMSSLVKTNTPTVVLKPNSKQMVTYAVTMPSQRFDGLIVGGINFIQSDKDTQKKGSSLAGVNNRYAYTEAIVLHGKTEKSLGSLKLQRVSVGRLNHKKAVFSTLVNNKNNFVNQLQIDQKIYTSDERQMLYHSENKMLQVAPNSKFKWVAPLNGTKFKPGRYKLVIDASATHSRKWHFVRYIDIDNAGKKSMNSILPISKKTRTVIYLFITASVILLALIFVIFAHRNNKKDSPNI